MRCDLLLRATAGDLIASARVLNQPGAATVDTTRGPTSRDRSSDTVAASGEQQPGTSAAARSEEIPDGGRNSVR